MASAERGRAARGRALADPKQETFVANRMTPGGGLLSLLLKRNNHKKVNSHEWFFQGVCHTFAERIHYAFLTDAGTGVDRNCLRHLCDPPARAPGGSEGPGCPGRARGSRRRPGAGAQAGDLACPAARFYLRGLHDVMATRGSWDGRVRQIETRLSGLFTCAVRSERRVGEPTEAALGAPVRAELDRAKLCGAVRYDDVEHVCGPVHSDMPYRSKMRI